MRKEVTTELEVAAPADEVWAVYSTLQFVQLISKVLPTFIDNIQVLEGDGAIGTTINVIFASGCEPSSYMEEFTVIDNEKRIKEAKTIEGGFLDMGYKYYSNNFQVIETGSESCIIKSWAAYEEAEPEVDDNNNNNNNQVSVPISIEVLRAAAEAVSAHVLAKRAGETTDMATEKV